MTNMIFSLVVAMTIYGEAGIEDLHGKRLVASTIYNNAKLIGGDFDRATTKVCLKRKKYSCWNEPFEIDYSSRRWSDSVKAAQEIHRKGYKPVTRATHYYAKYIRKPYWVKSMVYLGSHGQHVFYKERKRV